MALFLVLVLAMVAGIVTRLLLSGSPWKDTMDTAVGVFSGIAVLFIVVQSARMPADIRRARWRDARLMVVLCAATYAVLMALAWVPNLPPPVERTGVGLAIVLGVAFLASVVHLVVRIHRREVALKPE